MRKPSSSIGIALHMRSLLHFSGILRVTGGEVAIAPALKLLDALAAEGSVQGAAHRIGVSYRSAWGHIATLEKTLGQAVTVKTKGHGSVLTPFGVEFAGALRATAERCQGLLDAEAPVLDARLAALIPMPASPLRFAVSNDALLMQALAGHVVAILGSTDAVARLADGAVEIAGFHFGGHRPEPGSVFAALFEDPTLRVSPAFRRGQGLMIAPGNPLDIRSVADLPQRRARFVNRQAGAGTRIWFDRLCAEAGISPATILGYETEEFTHQAVAALIASGAADAGMGTRAAAKRFGLAFLPLGEETYFLAARRAEDSSRLDAILEDLARRAGETSGYAAP
jgi:molybdate transport repressor ModE-like protein